MKSIKFKEYLEKYVTHRKIVSITSSCTIGDKGNIVDDCFSEKIKDIDEKKLSSTDLMASSYKCSLCQIIFEFPKEVSKHWRKYHNIIKVSTFLLKDVEESSPEERVAYLKSVFESDNEISQVDIIIDDNKIMTIYRASFDDYYNNQIQCFNRNINILK